MISYNDEFLHPPPNNVSYWQRHYWIGQDKDCTSLIGRHSLSVQYSHIVRRPATSPIPVEKAQTDKDLDRSVVVRLSVRRSVRPSVRQSDIEVSNFFFFFCFPFFFGVAIVHCKVPFLGFLQSENIPPAFEG